MRRLTLAIGFLSLLSLSAAGQAVHTQTAPAPKAPGEVLSPIDAWMKCSECTEQDLQDVVKLGESAVPALGLLLRDGPPAASRQAMQNLLLAQFRNLKEFEKSHPQSKVSVTEQMFVNIYMDNYVARFQVRAAAALSRIGGPAAQSLLEEAQNASVRRDVQQAVRRELDGMNARKK
jgi:hypothetical protein